MSERTWGEIEREIREDYLRADGPESVQFRRVQWDVRLTEYTRVKQAEAWERGRAAFEQAWESDNRFPYDYATDNPYRKGENND